MHIDGVHFAQRSCLRHLDLRSQNEEQVMEE